MHTSLSLVFGMSVCVCTSRICVCVDLCLCCVSAAVDVYFVVDGAVFDGRYVEDPAASLWRIWSDARLRVPEGIQAAVEADGVSPLPLPSIILFATRHL